MARPAGEAASAAARRCASRTDRGRVRGLGFGAVAVDIGGIDCDLRHPARHRVQSAAWHIERALHTCCLPCPCRAIPHAILPLMPHCRWRGCAGLPPKGLLCSWQLIGHAP